MCVCINIIVIQRIYNGHWLLNWFGWSRYALLYTLSSILTVYLFAINKGMIVRFLSNKFMIWIGDISAYAFLIHQIVIRYYDTFVRRIYPPGMISWIKGVNCFLITLILAVVWEYMFVRKRRKKSL